MSQVIEIGEGQHSELGPSAADRWMNCPGSVLASRGRPDHPSKYAIEGTAAHTVSEWVRKQNVPASTFKGITVRVQHAPDENGNTSTDVKCGKPMVDGVQTFVDAVRKHPGYEIIEGRVHYAHGFGTQDSAMLMPRLGRSTDFKFGTGVKKDAKWNPQLLHYAVGTHLQWDWLFGFKKWILGISQPRLKHHDEWEISAKDLMDWYDDVAIPAAWRALTPNQPRVAGEWCQFCRIKKTCSVRNEYNREVGKVKNAKLVSQHFSAIQD